MERYFTSIEEMPSDPHLRNPTTWYGVACLKMPDFYNSPNHLIAVLDADYVQADRSRYMSDGISLEQCNVRIVVRTTDYASGLSKIRHIVRTLEKVQDREIIITSENRGEFDDRNNTPLSGEKQTILSCSMVETIRDQGLDATGRRYVFAVLFAVRFSRL